MLNIHITSADWAYNLWEPSHCSIELNTSGTFTAVDHKLQRSVATATTKQEVEDFLNSSGWIGKAI